jgi:hypothetical protein
MRPQKSVRRENGPVFRLRLGYHASGLGASRTSPGQQIASALARVSGSQAEG